MSTELLFMVVYFVTQPRLRIQKERQVFIKKNNSSLTFDNKVNSKSFFDVFTLYWCEKLWSDKDHSIKTAHFEIHLKKCILVRILFVILWYKCIISKMLVCIRWFSWTRSLTLFKLCLPLLEVDILLLSCAFFHCPS